MKKQRRLKKGLVVLLTAAMVVGLMPGVGTMKVSAATVTDVWNGSTATSFAGGSGTEEDPYQIATGAQLAYFAKVVNATTYADNDYAKAYYQLTADIDLNNKTLGPIGKGSGSCFSVFNGCFDGNNKTISNLSGSYGLFYYVGGDVTIKDLTIENINISHTSLTAGLVYQVYENKGTSALISNCHVSGTITINSTSWGGAGLVLDARSPLTIENCSNSANITGAGYSAGILGKNYTQSTFDDYFITIRNCTNSGRIVNTSTYSGSVGAAGIAGSLQYGKTLIENCVNTGEIVAQNGGEKFAGIVSYSESTAGNTIRNCENYGDVTCDVAKTNIYTAGICAFGAYTEIYDCSNVGTIHNHESALYCGGIVARRASSSDAARGSVYNCLNVGIIEPSYGGQIIGSEDTLSNVYDNYYVSGNLAANSVNNQNNYRVTQEQAGSGYLAFVLNGMTNGNVWKQKLGTDQYPKINGSEDIVYANGNCSARVTEYSNTPLSMDADKNHDLIFVEAKDADCGHNGYREHYECKSCNAFFEKDTGNEPVSKSDFITGTATGNHQSYDKNGLCAVCGNAYESAVKDTNGVYVIDNTGKFIWYANRVTNYNYISIPVGDAEIQLDGFDAKLEADIDLSLVYNEDSGKSWTPIAYDYSKYLNELDGQGHRINGLYINSASLNYAGLVETMYYKTAYIHDIVFTNVNINAPRAAYVGTVAGKLESLKTAPCIENCIVESGTINGKTYVGGLVGYVCSNNADKFLQEDKNIINNCANFANVNSTSYAGGLVGYTEANGKNVNIANCYNVGTITGGTSGDIVGKIDTNTAVVNCYHIGNNAFGENNVSATAGQKTSEQFASGEVAYLLQNGQTAVGDVIPEVWGQNLGEGGDAYPVLGGVPVYRNVTYADCEGVEDSIPSKIEYSNTELPPVYADHTDNDGDGICDSCGNRFLYLVYASSRLLGTDDTVANISMNPIDGKVKVGESVTVTAQDMLGFSFKGWYLASDIDTETKQLASDAQAQSTSFAYKFTPEADMSLVAVYEAAGKVDVTIYGSGFRVSVNDGEASSVQGDTYSEQLAIGSKVTIAIVEDNDNFINWTNENKKIVSTVGTYTFTVTGNTSLIMSKKGTTGSTAMVEFVSAYNQVITSQIYSSTDEISLPDGPSKMGYIFTGWSLTQDEIHTRITNGETHITVTPVYEQDTSKTYSVTVYVDGVQDDTQTVSGVLPGTTKTVTAPDVDGKVFLYWTDADGNILGYDASYFMQINKDIIVKAVYGQEAVEVKPVIAMTNVFTTSTGGKNKISFTVTRDIPEVYTLVEHGVLYNKIGTIDNPSEDTFVLGGTEVSKYTATTTKLSGIVTVNLNMTGSEDVKVVARGYMIVKNSEGKDEIYYSDIAYTSYNENK